jgi:hypothetical protein
MTQQRTYTTNEWKRIESQRAFSYDGLLKSREALDTFLRHNPRALENSDMLACYDSLEDTLSYLGNSTANLVMIEQAEAREQLVREHIAATHKTDPPVNQDEIISHLARSVSRWKSPFMWWL